MVVALVSLLAFQQPMTPPTVAIKLEKTMAQVGSVVKGKATVTFAEGLHSYQNPPSQDYQIPLKLSVVEKGFTLAKVSYPKGTDMTMPGEDKPSKVYDGTIVIPFELKASTKPATYRVGFKVDYQQCNATSCYPPDLVVVKVPLKLMSGKAK